MAALRLLLLSAVVVLLSAVTFSEGMRYGSAPKSCCFDYTQKSVKLSMVRSYSFTSQQCSKQAVLFTLKKGRQVCARPTDPWVKDHIKALSSKNIGGQEPL
ncbi:chemokine (C-C motif) ligand 35, duplicate 1 [Colossoma macropomum]|uniref:chemokine (C-C motif) ligand 35, duplicate 1 n=1 Tax=Colossoma macropomum TaxID=42526 RepID=UPI0018645B7E|nr:chemokine (C-C motif) ligand 35, duplicate 1 [Colossoma macropomum]